MAHQTDKLPWESLASVFELKTTNSCQHNAYNFHARTHADDKKKLANFLDAFMQRITEDAIRQRKQYPYKYYIPNENDIIISDEVAAKITPTVRRWHPEEYTPVDEDDLETFKQPCLRDVCPHTKDSNKCGCALPFKERKMAAFQRAKVENYCWEFEKDNGEAFQNLQVVKTLLLHGEMDPVLRSCAFKGSQLSEWWEESECECLPSTVGWNRICKYAIKMYTILNILYCFPESWDYDGASIDDYRKIKAYQVAVRSCTKTDPHDTIAMFPHWDFLGIQEDQFTWHPRPIDFPRWKHIMELDEDYHNFWFDSDDIFRDEFMFKLGDGPTEDPCQKSEYGSSDEHEDEDIQEGCYKLSFFPYGLMSYEEFLNFENIVGYQANLSDIPHVRWILCQKGLPVEISGCILEYADYTPRGSLPLSGKPLHPQCRQELDRYLEYCWQLIVRCFMLGYELKEKMDIDGLLRIEVKRCLVELFRSFPDEILYQIFAELEDCMPLEKWHMYGAQLDHQGASALHNLCLVCRRFRRLAQPLLYRTILIEGRERAKYVETLLLRTLVENPQLGEEVRVVSLTDNVNYPKQIDILGKDRTKAIISSALRNLDHSPDLKRRTEILIPECGFAALLLAYMPHVWFVDCTADDPRTPLTWLLSSQPEEVRFNDGFDYNNVENIEDIEDPEEDWSFSNTTVENFGFSNLTELRIRTVDNEEFIQNADMIEPLLLNPTLKVLRTFGTAWFGDGLADLEFPQHINYNLEYFDLMETYIDDEGLMTILERCPKLKGIHIQLPDDLRERPMEYEDDDFFLSYRNYGDVLREHGQYLEEFSLHTYHFEESSSSPGEGRIGSLKELKSLRHLKVSKDLLIGKHKDEAPPLRLIEVLPESIETLYLYLDSGRTIQSYFGYQDDVYNQDVHALLLDGMPNLREIRMERTYSSYDNLVDNSDEHDEGSEGYYHTDGSDSRSDDDDHNPPDEKGDDSKVVFNMDIDEWPAELHVDGWKVSIARVRLWEIRGRPAYKRKIVTLTRKT
ncbi:hypothetical protein FBEOM_3709 [Fusarium beomiforme]|uniref:F-box domain-containing protein n=1 Tax=Fusarium beomiforme TaxID=44412 RepID=A0A9P5APE0_9HYPO|nr:hypothetical protein FBEOM_3709 [Fusarium beomiforme]